MYTLDGVEIDPALGEGVCLLTGRVARFTPLEVRLLSFLRSRGGDGAPYGSILPHVYGMRPDLETHRLEQMVYRIRIKWRDAFGRELPLHVRDNLYTLIA